MLVVKRVGPNGLPGHHFTPSPVVYLDHWALLDISLDLARADRLVSAIKAAEGTLAISWINLLEMADVGDFSQVEKVAGLVRAARPNIALIHSDAQLVMANEVRSWAGPSSKVEETHLAMPYLEAIIQHDDISDDPADPLKWFTHFRGKEFTEMCKSFFSRVTPKLELLREDALKDHKLRAMLKRPISGPKLPRLTKYIWTAVRNLVALDKAIDFAVPNNWRDVYHLVVPMAYADLMLLDNAWWQKSEQVRRLIEPVSGSGHLAKCFRARTFADFWKALEDWKRVD